MARTLEENDKKCTVDLVIFACLNFHEFSILGLLTTFRIRELSISIKGSADNNNFSEILKFANLYSSQNSLKLKPRENYRIYSIAMHCNSSLNFVNP